MAGLTWRQQRQWLGRPAGRVRVLVNRKRHWDREQRREYLKVHRSTEPQRRSHLVAPDDASEGQERECHDDAVGRAARGDVRSDGAEQPKAGVSRGRAGGDAAGSKNVGNEPSHEDVDGREDELAPSKRDRDVRNCQPGEKRGVPVRGAVVRRAQTEHPSRHAITGFRSGLGRDRGAGRNDLAGCVGEHDVVYVGVLAGRVCGHSEQLRAPRIGTIDGARR